MGWLFTASFVAWFVFREKKPPRVYFEAWDVFAAVFTLCLFLFMFANC